MRCNSYAALLSAASAAMAAAALLKRKGLEPSTSINVRPLAFTTIARPVRCARHSRTASGISTWVASTVAGGRGRAGLVRFRFRGRLKSPGPFGLSAAHAGQSTPRSAARRRAFSRIPDRAPRVRARSCCARRALSDGAGRGMTYSPTFGPRGPPGRMPRSRRLSRHVFAGPAVRLMIAPCA